MNGYYNHPQLAQKYPRIVRRGWTESTLRRWFSDGIIDAMPEPGSARLLYSEADLVSLLNHYPRKQKL